MEDRILELEEQLSYLSKRVADLDAVVVEFTERVVTQERLIARLRDELARERERDDPAEPPPPHY